MALVYTSYLRLATRVASSPSANSLLIFICSLPPLLLGKHYGKHGTQPETRRNYEREDEQVACGYYQYPLWLSFLLLASTAIELPLILAFHPVTIAYPADILDLPSPGRLTLQVLGLFLMEGLCRRLIRSLVLPVSFKLRKEMDEDQDQEDGEDEHIAEDDIATNAVVDFSTARITLMVGSAILGMPRRGSLTGQLGKLHPLSVAGWAIVDGTWRNL
ncbi:hypothetical protein AN8439.2 [Aspergillus nidulans FGSC A4]|jgi:hypothetical protein|uniref:Uncharacterized protein n=1 Tax=Emericella nidulans (strain FGSC A4 / ATCC 38163 / CBS 112.46 / NRRL 194 / M139) TaxID=227321 RepID=Q5ATE1_EMENI|nr:hypothetical protein [Aspergillus nidulans FGSC A4]EAA67061.1 hypothetical protein AN8439.2 [Aspergillus nidulans FGSC A4]CBF80554.1 TPA: conserved hypothetical protein [Aspergillus nidulans FGSC A4]|eukprot:XP_681708.1 hypothetical protein AN8439.2 [Aspergillus nidulans FGSC A4]